MDRELRLLLTLTRRLPQIRGSGRLGHSIARFYRRRPREPVVTDVLDFRMRLDPMEYVEGDLLFVPQIYDRGELARLRTMLGPGSVFLDVGANVGFYSLVASRLVGEDGLVLAIEADPEVAERLRENLDLNGCRNVRVVPCGVSDRAERLSLGVNLRGNRGSSSFLQSGQRSVEVQCLPLLDVLRQHGVDRVDAAKLDVEGFGLRVLRPYLSMCTPEQRPRLVVIEKEDGVNDLLGQAGYDAVYESAMNLTFRRRERDDVPM
ncbi:MAG TPA: FkbM family methyltransferase [Gemmatimonadaceae bacterium]|nr:FkbM family methyltransferase [Gemmatimonadaceae bacterium]